MLDGGIGFKFWIWFYSGSPLPHGTWLLIIGLLLIAYGLWPTRKNHSRKRSLSFRPSGRALRRTRRKDTVMRRIITLATLVLAIMGTLFVAPMKAGAQPMDPEDYSQLPGGETLPEYMSFVPNAPSCGCGGLSYLDMPEGIIHASPQGKQLIAEYGGTATIAFYVPTLFQVISPEQAIEISVDGRPYAATNYLTNTGTQLVLHIKPGPGIGSLSIQIEAALPGLDPSTPAKAKEGNTYFKETGHNVPPFFMEYWNAHGGLSQFGFPISEPGYEQLEDGYIYLVQYFERARFEYHPENPSNMRILLGQFGREIHGTEAPKPAVKDDSYRYYQQTGHNVPEMFWRYWDTNGGLDQFGYPISEPQKERMSDGNVYLVQYFERARFEYHPENQKPYDILLGQFGRSMLASLADVRAETSR